MKYFSRALDLPVVNQDQNKALITEIMARVVNYYVCVYLVMCICLFNVKLCATSLTKIKQKNTFSESY